MLKSGKGGQITVFIIVGIIILILSGIIFYISSFVTSPLKQVDTTPINVESIAGFVEGCIRDSAEYSLQQTFLHGGYFQTPELSSYLEFIKVPYYIFLGEEHLPSDAVIESSLERYSYQYLRECIDLSIFRDSNITEMAAPQVRATIMDSKVLFMVDYPLTIEKTGSVVELSSFDVELDHPLRQKMLIVEDFLDYQQNDPNEVMLSYLITDSYEKGYQYNLEFEEDVVYYSFLFEDVELGDEPLLFNFAAKYGWEKDFGIEPMEEQVAIAGNPFTLQLNTSGENLLYQADTDMFTVDFNGLISFTPLLDSIGEYVIPISVLGNEGKVDQELLRLEVISFS